MPVGTAAHQLALDAVLLAIADTADAYGFTTGEAVAGWLNERHTLPEDPLWNSRAIGHSYSTVLETRELIWKGHRPLYYRRAQRDRSPAAMRRIETTRDGTNYYALTTLGELRVEALQARQRRLAQSA